jgi:LmbE family N-acetylglucosaminyl deacetylase
MEESLIIPKTLETAWLDALDDLPHFVPGSTDLVVISPHPDDETLGAGALIASHCDRGGRATIIAVTDGENAYENFPGLAAIRIREQEEAVQRLGGANAKLVRLNLTDSGVSDREEELTEALSGCVNDATHVIAPWNGDFHPDHEACGRAAATAANKTGARLSWYFFWTWHRGTPALLDKLPLKRFVFSDGLRERKWTALQSHRSQLEHISGEPILPERLLRPAKRNFEVFAEA